MFHHPRVHVWPERVGFASMLLGAALFLVGCPLTVSDDYEIGPSSGGGGTGASTGAAGGQGGAAGGGMGGGGAGAAGAGPSFVSCPVGLAGPELVPVLTDDGVAFCIDSTEVTAGDYATFLTTATTAGQPAECTWNDSFVPSDGWPASNANHPVRYVDWCDARAFCDSAGKRLCGRIEGGASNVNDTDNPQDQWYAACSDEQNDYPYSWYYDAGACNSWEAQIYGPVEVASYLSCQGSADGLYDMSGNLIEWVDACAGTSGEGDECLLRNGGWYDGAGINRCDYTWRGFARSSAFEDLGFRCCLDLPAGCTELGCLTDQGLVARWFIDEASSGTAPTALEDAAPDPLSLALVYAGNLSYVEEAGHRGLRWTNAGGPGAAFIALQGTKIQSRLDGTTAATFEMVATIDGLFGSSRFLEFDDTVGDSLFSLVAETDDLIDFRLNGVYPSIEWWKRLPTSTRRVFHVVVDTNQPHPPDRIKLFVNGMRAGRNFDQAPFQGEQLGLGDVANLYLGNRDTADRSFAGALFYAALYDRALGRDEVVGHAQVLLATDDR